MILAALQLSAGESNSLIGKHKSHTGVPEHGHQAPGTSKDLRSVSSLLMSTGDVQYNGSFYFFYDTSVYTYSHGRAYSPIEGWMYDTLTSATYDTTSGVFTNSSRSIQYFDGSDHDTAILIQNWNTGTNTWDNYQLQINHYNAAAYIDTITILAWSGSWVNSFLAFYTYDANNNRTQELYQSWSSSAWVNNNLTEYNFNAAGYDTLSTYFNWSTAQAIWDTNRHSIFTYDAQNNEISETDQMYVSPGVWSNTAQTQYSNFIYPHDPAEELDLSSFGGSNPFDTIQGILYNYTTDGFPLIQQTENYTAGSFSVQPGNYIQRYHYIQDSTVGIAAVSADNVKLYPNPTTGTCHLSLTSALADDGTLAVTDLTGRTVKTITLSGSETTFQTGDMSAGMYLCTISSGSKTICTKKLLVE